MDTIIFKIFSDHLNEVVGNMHGLTQNEIYEQISKSIEYCHIKSSRLLLSVDQNSFDDIEKNQLMSKKETLAVLTDLLMSVFFLYTLFSFEEKDLLIGITSKMEKIYGKKKS